MHHFTKRYEGSNFSYSKPVPYEQDRGKGMGAMKGAISIFSKLISSIILKPVILAYISVW